MRSLASKNVPSLPLLPRTLADVLFACIIGRHHTCLEIPLQCPPPPAPPWRPSLGDPPARPGGGGISKGVGGLGWVELGQGLFRTRSLSVSARVSGTNRPRNSRLSGLKAYRIVDRPRAPRWHTREGYATVEVCVARTRGQGEQARQVTRQCRAWPFLLPGVRWWLRAVAARPTPWLFGLLSSGAGGGGGGLAAVVVVPGSSGGGGGGAVGLTCASLVTSRKRERGVWWFNSSVLPRVRGPIGGPRLQWCTAIGGQGDMESWAVAGPGSQPPEARP